MPAATNLGRSPSGSGCQPSASAAEASSLSGIPNAWTRGPWTADDSVVAWWGGKQPGCMVRAWDGSLGYPIANCGIEHKTSSAAVANARLIAAAPDYGTACGLDLHPGEASTCGPLAWLRSAVDTLGESAVRDAAQGDDPDAYFTMICECRLLLKKLEAANAKARGEQA